MSLVLAYEKLIADVRAEFNEYEVECENLFGWRVPAQHHVGDRIVWVPGDQTGDLGEVVAPKWPGRHPRPLATLGELFTVYITGRPPQEVVEYEEAQYHASRVLFDAWLRAVYRAAHGTFEIKRASWIVNRKERRATGAIRVLLALEAKVSDHANEEVQGNTVGGEFAMTINETPDAPVTISPPQESEP